METTRLNVEFQSDTDALTEALRERTEEALEKLTRGHDDLTGAAVYVRTNSGDSMPRDLTVRIVLYTRAQNLTVSESGESLSAVLHDALATLERQVRKHRDKRRRSKGRREDPPV